MPIEDLHAAVSLRLVVGNHIVDFGSLRVITHEDSLRLTPKAAGVLLELARHGGQTLTHDHLLDQVWAGTCPTRNVLTQAIKELRRALDEKDAESCIETVPKIGYRLIGPVELTAAEATDAVSADMQEAVSPRDWRRFALPVSLVIGGALLLWLVLMFRS